MVEGCAGAGLGDGAGKGAGVGDGDFWDGGVGLVEVTRVISWGRVVVVERLTPGLPTGVLGVFAGDRESRTAVNVVLKEFVVA